MLSGSFVNYHETISSSIDKLDMAKTLTVSIGVPAKYGVLFDHGNVEFLVFELHCSVCTCGTSADDHNVTLQNGRRWILLVR